jgi:enoyl-CoA hydratase/carnithine racemase
MPIEWEEGNGVGYITLNNPGKANVNDLSKAWIDLWEQRDIRCTIVSGAGDVHFYGSHNLAPAQALVAAELHGRNLLGSALNFSTTSIAPATSRVI